MFRVKSPQDLGAAAIFALIGAGGLWFGRDLVVGTAAKMGPGYFPLMLSGLILLLGAALAWRAISVSGPAIETIKPRPLVFILGGILLSGVLLDWAGLAVTTLVLTFIAAYARRDVNRLETLLLGAGLAIFCVTVFVYALKQPLPAFWWSQ